MEKNEASTSRGQKRKHPSLPTEKPYKWYRIENSKFYALIINVLRNRPGAEHDSTALKKLLPNCNFNIMMCTDLSPNGIKKSIVDFKSELKSKKGNIDGCIVALMSHGTKDEWFSTSIPEQRLSLYDDLVDQLNRKTCPYLDDIPKIFLVNVCRGKVEDPGCVGSNDTDENDCSDSTNPELFTHFGKDFEMDDSSISGSSWKDTLICYASYRGEDCVAYRYAGGSRFIQAFCEIVETQKRPTDIDTILRQVSDKLSKIPRKRENGFIYQTPCFLNVGYHRNLLYLAKREMGGSRRESLKSLEANFFHDSRKKITWPITHGLLTNVGNFSGREEQLKLLNTYFETEKNLVLVTGFGGIGKTELCKKFANDIYLNHGGKISRIWLHGETVDTLNSSVKEVADYLGVLNDADLSVYFSRIVQLILENSGRLLVVIDNVDEIYEEVKSIIKTIQNAKNKKMLIVVTSRDSLVLGSWRKKESIKLDELLEIEARNLLQNSLPTLTDIDADTLSRLVQYFPLALQQAVAYIVQQQEANFETPNYSVKKYVKEFEEKKELMLGHKLDEFDHDYELTTLVVWNVTIDKLKQECPSVGEILKIIAYFDPDNIKFHVLEKVCARRKLDFKKGIDMIYNYCLIQRKENFIGIHRLLQDVLRRENVTQEYCEKLFDDVFLVCYDDYNCDAFSILASAFHLFSVCKYAAFNCKFEDFCNLGCFEESLLFLLELKRLNCALELIKLKYPQLQFSPDLSHDEGKQKFVEKVFLWEIVKNGCDTVSNEVVETGDYNINWQMFNARKAISREGIIENYTNSLEMALDISRKYFGVDSLPNFLVKSKFVRQLCEDREIEKAITICEEIKPGNFNKEEEKIYFDTIFNVLETLCNTALLESSLFEKVKKIVKNFSIFYPENLELMGLLHGIVYDLKRDYTKALELISQNISYLKNGDYAVFECQFKFKEIELKIKTIDFNKVTREDVEREFDTVEYRKLSLHGLETIDKLFEINFGELDPLTIKVKVAIADKLCYMDEERCIKLWECVLNSPVDTEYKSAFSRLCTAKNIDNNYDEQKVILEKLLAQKESLGENNSNIIRVKQLLAKTKEKFGDLPGALELFEHVKKYAVDFGWDLKESRTNVARLKLKIGDLSAFKTRDDIYREFGEFDEYYKLSLEQRQKILPIYISVLGDSDELIYKLKLTQRRFNSVPLQWVTVKTKINFL